MGREKNVDIDIEKLYKSIIWAVRFDDIPLVFKGDEEAVKAFQEFQIKMTKYQSNKEFNQDEFSKTIQDFIRNCVSKYKDKIDEEALLMIFLYNSRDELQRISKEEDIRNPNVQSAYKQISDNIQVALNMLKNSERRIFIHEIDNKTMKMRIKAIYAQDLINCVKARRPVSKLMQPSTKQREKFKRLEDTLNEPSLKSLFSIIDVGKIDVFLPDMEYAKEMIDQIVFNGLAKYEEDQKTQNKKLDYGMSSIELADIIRAKGIEAEAIEEAIKSNLKYIDIDKLLLLIGYEIIQNIENDTLNVWTEDKENLINTKREMCLKIFKVCIAFFIQEIEESTSIIIEDEHYTLEDLGQALLRFNKGKYIKKETIDNLKKMVIDGKISINEIPEDIQECILWKKEEILGFISKKPENLAFIINCDDKIFDILELISAIDKLSDESFFTLFNKGDILIENVIDFLEQGKITEEQVMGINLEDNMKQKMYNTIRELYCSIKQKESNKGKQDESLRQYNNYANIYRLLFVKGKTDQQQSTYGNELIAIFEEDLSEEVLKDLYQTKLISLEVAVDWGLDLKEMLSENELKPTDLKQLYKNNTIKIDQIKDVIQNGKLSNDEKQDLIYSTFDGDTPEEIKIRNELIQLLTLGESYKGTSNKTKMKRNGSTTTDRKEYVSDPQTRWKLISLLDSDYSKKFLTKGMEVIDGHRLFLLPNSNEIVIEKMYEYKKGTMINAYGSATYIINTNMFYDNVNGIIIDNAINRSFLRELSENNNATKIIHTKNWGSKIMEHFGINEQNTRYTEEEREEIKSAAYRVVNSRQERV